MLRQLEIRDMLLIERLDLAFRPGLNVLTGETGAGKSILLDCLGFVLGWRGRGDLIRPGAAEGEVTAVFDLPPGHPARGVLAEAGLPDGGEELILRRTAGAGGRASAFVNDRRAGAETLRALADTLVEFHGQDDDRGLLDARGHRRLLDAFAGAEPLLAEVRAAWAARREAEAARAAAAARLEAVRAEEDWLRHAVEELDRLAPAPGEEARLDALRRRMQAAERVRGELLRAAELLAAGGVEAALIEALRRLEAAAPRLEGALDPVLAALGRVFAELAEAERELNAVLAGLETDPAALEAAEERLFAIRALARKHGVLPDDLAEHAAALRARAAALEAGEAEVARLSSAAGAAAAAHAAACARLSARRRQAAAALDAAVAAELPALRLDRAVFRTEITPAQPGPEGAEAVAFTVATNRGAPAGPIERIASGGERARFLLALRVCLAREGQALTLIFDEIDRGVGGATADAVGRRLARLASTAQVIVVTHSPQVAARGAHHWRVAKREAAGRTVSEVVPLTPRDRVDEIARMLAGERVTEAARRAAEALIAGG
jgi:DNA repair protein RecN (Recombination protein N)